jgi:hypothetical protein
MPTIRLAVPRSAPIVRVAKRRATRRSSSSGAGSVSPIKAAVTAAVIGLAEKSGVLDSLPEIPIIGRKGTLALVAFYWARHGGGPIARDVALAAAALCGYQWGREGKVTGEE